MQTLRRAAAVLVYPAILCFAVACERSNAPPTSPSARAPRADLIGSTTSDATEWLARALSIGIILSDDPTATPWTDELETDPPDNDPIHVDPFQFDPSHTDLVRARWLRGTGCPTGATLSDGSPETDGACPTGDPKDKKNAGLLLVKTGPTSNVAAAGAEVKGVKGITLTELGYDIRKAGATTGSPLGSHCGAGAPRFNVVTTDGTTQTTHFLGCNSPPGMVASFSTGWERLRWGPAELLAAFPPILPTDVVQSIAIIFDEGQDPSGGPDSFGLAVLDNIDINGTLVGRGPGN
ncbi:MAG TPA: hypothetical protein VM716_08925 [Gemmatimonadales bacterium]|nr:hypothetical protein [Gemmatimonadales bacterium]